MSSPTTTLGIVSEFEGERVETDFHTLLGLVPLLPAQSYYRRSEDQRYAIDLHPLSVTQALLANHGAYLAIALAGFGLLNLGQPIGGLLIILGGVTALIAGFARFRLGKLTPDAERRRAIHLEVTGVSGLPSMLPQDLVQTLRDALERKWSKRHDGCWRELLDEGQAEAEDLKLLMVLAALDARVEPAAQARLRANAAWNDLQERFGDIPLESLSPEEALKVMRQLTSDEKRAEEQKPAKAEAKKKAPVERAKPIAQLKAEKKKAKKKRDKRSRGIKIRCERCDHVARVPETCAGQTGRCPSCERGIRVPSQKSMRLLKQKRAA